MKRQIALVLASSFLFVAGTASAQGYYPPPPPPSYGPPPPPPAPPLAVIEQGERQWDRSFGLGIRTSTQTMANTDSANADSLTLNGLGVHLRYRVSRRWSFELTVEGTTGGIGDEYNIYKRVSKSGTLASRLHLTTNSLWDWYLLLGLGASGEQVTYRTIDGSQRTEQLSQSHVHFGSGIERRFGQLAFGAELRFVGAGRDDKDSPRYEGIANGPIPQNSAGTQFNLAATYYF